MQERKAIAQELTAIEQEMRELEIRYEQYFAGVEKRPPMQEREKVARRLRQFANRRIIQTDLRFRYQNLATRFHSYAGHWDRILRLIEEGRYGRHCQWPRASAPPLPAAPAEAPGADAKVDAVYRQLVAARGTDSQAPPIDKNQIAAFLEKQTSRIREKFGDREVEFVVETEDGKPKIKVRPKK